MAASDDQLRRALEAIRTLKARVAAAEEAAAAPIAIVGLGVRFPGGVTTPDALWQLLRDGVDATSEVPPNRWDAAAFYDADPEAAGKILTRRGGFLADVEHFDPRHFGLAPKEAPHLDPQQRLLLETAWEALEHAAIAPDRLAGRSAGVYIGISASDYAQRLFSRGPESIDPYVGSGNAHSVAAGRIAYTLGLHGPAVAVDTACSSSLVATHLAVQALRTGDCELALAGGVNLLLSPTVSVNHSRARMLSPDGRCKAFAADADGFGRAEGCAVIVLKRLDAAQRDGDRILAVIRGSASNQDGRTSGLTVPNGNAQQTVIRAALAQARLNPADVDYVEAHGTGTALGDPIEAHALGAVFADRATVGPLQLGSIKSNFGHCEAAAGLAGLVKVVLALQHEILPPHLHATTPSPRIDWDQLPLALTSTARPWPRRADRPRIAGVSSFGFGGTNAHLVLAEAPAPDATLDPDEPADLLPLSARTPTALAQIATDLAAYQLSHDVAWSDLCHTHAVGRASFAQRTLITGPEIKLGPTHTVTAAPRIAFLFSGQGSLGANIGLSLRASVPAFATAFDEAAAIVRAEAGWDVAGVLADPDRVARTQYGQVGLFCLSYALARTWQAWGVQPEVVLGHSVGEYAAACIAGALTLPDALRLLMHRATAMGQLGETGAMLAVSAAAEAVAPIAQAAGAEIGAYNAPRQTVVTGPRPVVEACAQQLTSAGLRHVPLAVRQGYHSVEMEPMLADFQRVAATTPFAPPHCAFISTVTGQLADTDLGSADYWTRQIRQPVRWRDAIQSLRDHGADLIIEVGPRGLLTALSQHTWSEPGPNWLTSLQGRPDENEAATLRAAAAHAWQQGAPIDFAAVQSGRRRRRLALPTYPFERQRYWCDPAPELAPCFQVVRTPLALDSATDAPEVRWLDLATDPTATPLSYRERLFDSATPVGVLLPSDHPHVSAWIGAAKVFALEFPTQWRGAFVTTAPTATPLANTSAPVAFASTDGTWLAPQLRPLDLPARPWRARSDRTYLITGGLGALGQHLAHWLVAQGARHLLLLGRRAPTPAVTAALDALRAQGATITTASVDVTDRSALAAALANLSVPLGGVFHAAGAAAYQLFPDIDEAAWHAATAAKMLGARYLDELTADLDLDAFVLFSSIASVWGSQGQAHYAAANQALDDLALARHARGLPALSVNWGPWSGGGMATPEATARLTATGVQLLPPTAALATLGALLTSDQTQAVVAQVDWPPFREVFELRGPTHLLAALPSAAAPSPTVTAAPVLAEHLAAAPATERLPIALAHVQRVVAEVLSLPTNETVPPHTGFADLGIDSLMAITLRRRLAAELGTELSATLVFDHPDCERLARHLLDRFDATASTSAEAVDESLDADDAAAAAELERKLARLGL